MEIRSITGRLDVTTLEKLMVLHDRVFGSGSNKLEVELDKKHNLHIAAAFLDDELIGYKIGYERKDKHFYSWLGGVDPRHRKKGIGQALLLEQHDWCTREGYHTIRTHTKNRFKNMLILNLKNGFDVIGTFTDQQGEPKIILEKKLTS